MKKTNLICRSDFHDYSSKSYIMIYINLWRNLFSESIFIWKKFGFIQFFSFILNLFFRGVFIFKKWMNRFFTEFSCFWITNDSSFAFLNIKNIDCNTIVSSYCTSPEYIQTSNRETTSNFLKKCRSVICYNINNSKGSSYIIPPT